MRSRSAAITLSVALTAAALVVPTGARAHDTGLYLSLKLGTTDVDASFGDAFDAVAEGDDDSRTVELGYRWSRFWALQAGYHDLGRVPGFGDPCDPQAEVCAAVVVPVEAETKAYSLSIVPQLPLGRRLSIFGKVGLVALESEVRGRDAVAELFEKISEEDVIWGIGLRLGLLGPLQLFYEYEGIGEDFETQAFGATWQF